MREEGIHAVVNMREESDDADRGLAPEHYLWLPITDDTAPSLEDLEKGATFIQSHVEEGKGVYVHCKAGVGRAPTMAAAYLVHQGATPEEAWAILKEGRPFIRPTPPQLDVIRAYAGSRYVTPEATGADEISPSPQSLGAAAPSSEPSDSSMDLEPRVERAFEQIAGDPGLTSDLTDAQAETLLSWAESEVRRLVKATRGMDHARAWTILDPQLSVLRRHLRETARQSARTEHPEDALQARLSPPEYPDLNE
jgi:hypothetical protein